MPPLQRVQTTFRLPLAERGAGAPAGRVELLAPAGSFEALVAAVENGADAVYLAGQHFGARKFAKNFTDDELARGVAYAHVRGVKVFLTVNTLVFNEEFPDLVRFLALAHDVGVDAIIVQDLGVMKAARELFPDLPVHVSTQATVHNSRGIRFLESLGAERVILARENTLKDIQGMKERTGAELEHFVHGAQCYCYSGQCLMSSVIGERSGNRGACAYTCRLPFSLEESDGERAAGAPPTVLDSVGFHVHPQAREKHVLSSKDLNTLLDVPKLIEAGVNSFKIEGRMKRPEYVAIVTAAYRAAIDRHYAGRFFVTDEERSRVEKVFNREFTPGFLLGKEKWSFTSWDTSGNRGTILGEVVASGPGWVRVKLEQPLRVKDGIEILHYPTWGREKGGDPEEYGFAVHDIRVSGRRVAAAEPGQVVDLKGEQRSAPGDPVYKTADAETLEWARATYQGPPRRRIAIELRARIRIGEPLVVEARDPARGIEARHTSEYVVPRAKSAPLTRERALDPLGKLGETCFEAARIDLDLAPDAFAPMSVLTAARAAACEALERAIEAKFRRKPVARLDAKMESFLRFPTVDRAGTRATLAVNCWNLEILKAALRGGAKAVYLSGLRAGGLQPKWDFEALREGVRLAREAGARLHVASGMIQKDWEVEMLEQAVREHAGSVAGVLAGNHAAFHVARAEGVPAIADWPMNVYNSVTVEFLRENGAERITLSPELTLDQIAEVGRGTRVPLEALAHGRLTLMTSEYCSIGHATRCQMPGGTWAPCHDHKYRLNDRRDAAFPLETDGACRMYILNSVELSMINRIPDLARAGVDVLRVETIGTRPEAVETQVRVYLEALASYAEDPAGYQYRREWWDTLAAACPEGFTSGHYYRGPG